MFACSSSWPRDALGMLLVNKHILYNLTFQTDLFLGITRIFFQTTLLKFKTLSNLYLFLGSRGMLSDVSVACKCSSVTILFRCFWETEKHFYCCLFDDDWRLDLATYSNLNLCVTDINALIYYRSVHSGWNGYVSHQMAIKPPRESCVFIQAFVCSIPLHLSQSRNHVLLL